jgi:hypothetical protein
MSDSDIASKQRETEAALSWMRVLAKSATVSIADVNTGGDYFHPMGRTRGSATKGSSPASAGEITPILGT